MSLRCINCDIRLTRHLLSHESDALKEVMRLWTYPREITNTDYICHACWDLGNAQASGLQDAANQQRQVGHHNICVGCGRSVLRLSSRTIIRSNPSNDESPIINIISRWIYPRQLTSTDQACTACWLRAQRTLRRQQLVDEPVVTEGVTTCVHCNERLVHGASHVLANEDESVVNMIKTWIFPNNVNPIDHICHACWQLATEATQQDSEASESASQPLQANDPHFAQPQASNQDEPSATNNEIITLLRHLVTVYFPTVPILSVTMCEIKFGVV